MTLIHDTLGARNEMANGIDTLVSFGTGQPEFRIMQGTQAAPGTQIISLLLNNPAFLNAVNGTIQMNTLNVGGVVSTPGTAGHFRIQDPLGNLIFTGNIGLIGSGADLEFNTLTFPIGANISISSFSYTTSS